MKNKLFILSPIIMLLLSGCNTDNTTYNVTLDPNGGSVTSTTLTFKKGESIELPIPSKENKSFLGWYTGWTENDVLVDSSTKIEKDYKLIAKWDTYDLTYIDGNDNVVAIDSVNPGSVATKIDKKGEKLPTPEKWYTFSDWVFDYSTIINQDYKIYGSYTDEDIVLGKTRHSLMIADKSLDYYYAIKKASLSKSSDELRKDLTSYAFGLSMANSSKDSMREYFSIGGFDSIYTSPSYEVPPTKDSVSYAFAHNVVNEQRILAISIKGLNYGAEWANNFDIGETGNHKGFYLRGSEVYNAFMSYVNEHSFDLSSSKVIVSGYSRAGGIANVMGYLMNNAKDEHEHPIFTNDNLFVYTFEAPTCLELSHCEPYSNVMNYFNGADLVAKIPPEEYGLGKCGTNIDIHANNVDELLNDFDSSLSLPQYKSTSDYPDEVSFVTYLLDKILNIGDDPSYTTDPEYRIKTRSDFVTNLSPTLMYAMNLVFSLHQSTLDAIIADLKDKIDNQKYAELLEMLYLENGIFNYLNPFIKDDGIVYSEDELKTHTEIIRYFCIRGAFMPVLTIMMAAPNNLQRAIYMHTLEINYLLLNNYLENN